MRFRWLFAIALLLAVPRLAEAHATLVRSTPAAGSHLSATPGRIVLVFSEELETGLARVSIVGSDGRTINLETHGDPRDVNSLIASIDPLPDDAYRLVWRVVSADGHPVNGSFVFTVGTGSARKSASPPVVDEHDHTEFDVPLLTASLRGVAVGLLMALAGLLAFGATSTPGLAETSVRRSNRLAGWIALLAAVFCVLHLAAWIVHVSPSHSFDAGSVNAAVTSDVGRMELWRTGLTLLAAWALLLARRSRLALLFAFGALLVSGATGHSAAISPLYATPAKIAHLLTGALWFGGLIWLLTVDGADRAILAEARRVSSAALVAVLVVSVSGVLQALLFLPTPMDLVRTTYGAIVIAKAVGLLALVAFGAQHRFRSLPRLEGDLATSRPFRVSLATELALMTVVIMLGGVLAYVPPVVSH
jgi:copper transport protein